MTIISTRRRNNNIRKSAQRKLPQLVKEQCNQCYYCHCDIVVLSELRKRRDITDIAVSEKRIITWTECYSQLRRTAKQATTEHLTRISDGGNNHLYNLVASCFDCNQIRGLLDEKLTPGVCKYCKALTHGFKSACNRCVHRNARRNKRINTFWFSDKGSDYY